MARELNLTEEDGSDMDLVVMRALNAVAADPTTRYVALPVLRHIMTALETGDIADLRYWLSEGLKLGNGT